MVSRSNASWAISVILCLVSCLRFHIHFRTVAWLFLSKSFTSEYTSCGWYRTWRVVTPFPYSMPPCLPPAHPVDIAIPWNQRETSLSTEKKEKKQLGIVGPHYVHYIRHKRFLVLAIHVFNIAILNIASASMPVPVPVHDHWSGGVGLPVHVYTRVRARVLRVLECGYPRH